MRWVHFVRLTARCQINASNRNNLPIQIIVAPILNKRQTRRNITLPSGIWLDMINLRNEKGGKTLQNYEIRVNQIAYFKKVKE